MWYESVAKMCHFLRQARWCTRSRSERTSSRLKQLTAMPVMFCSRLCLRRRSSSQGFGESSHQSANHMGYLRYWAWNDRLLCQLSWARSYTEILKQNEGYGIKNGAFSLKSSSSIWLENGWQDGLEVCTLTSHLRCLQPGFEHRPSYKLSSRT